MKRTGLSCLALVVAAHPGTPAAAPPAFSGKDLARSAALYERARQEGKFHNEQEERQVNYFAGYVEGAALASRTLCIPSKRGTREQMSEITARYLRLHPREWHLAPDTLVVKALQPAFSCSKPKR